jgi:DNA mismatch repair ATPase MutS
MKAKPLADQWSELKEEFPRHIILIQCGYYYQTYEEDAEFLAELVRIKTFTKGQRTIAGFPTNSIDKFRTKIEALGYAIATLKQTGREDKIILRSLDYVTGRHDISQHVPDLQSVVNKEVPKKKLRKTAITIQMAKDMKEQQEVDIALTQIGYMFNAFEEDALILSQKIGLRSFDRYGIPTVGFPVTSTEKYFGKMINAELTFLTILQTENGPDGPVRTLGEVFRDIELEEEVLNQENQIPQGWYPDPSNPQQMRFWDGTQWTDQVAPLA